MLTSEIPIRIKKIPFDLEHVLSKTLELQVAQEKNAPKDISEANDDSSDLSRSARKLDRKSDASDETSTPSINLQRNSEKQTDSTQTENPAQIKSLLAEIQDDLINLAYIKNYNNQEESMTKQSQDFINSTQATNTQTTYLFVRDNMNHMLLSEEDLKKVTFGNPQISTDIGIQIIRSNPNQLKVTATPIH